MCAAVGREKAQAASDADGGLGAALDLRHFMDGVRRMGNRALEHETQVLRAAAEPAEAAPQFESAEYRAALAASKRGKEGSAQGENAGKGEGAGARCVGRLAVRFDEATSKTVTTIAPKAAVNAQAGATLSDPTSEEAAAEAGVPLWVQHVGPVPVLRCEPASIKAGGLKAGPKGAAPESEAEAAAEEAAKVPSESDPAFALFATDAARPVDGSSLSRAEQAKVYERAAAEAGGLRAGVSTIVDADGAEDDSEVTIVRDARVLSVVRCCDAPNAQRRLLAFEAMCACKSTTVRQRRVKPDHTPPPLLSPCPCTRAG